MGTIHVSELADGPDALLLNEVSAILEMRMLNCQEWDQTKWFEENLGQEKTVGGL